MKLTVRAREGGTFSAEFLNCLLQDILAEGVIELRFDDGYTATITARDELSSKVEWKDGDGR